MVPSSQIHKDEGDPQRVSIRSSAPRGVYSACGGLLSLHIVSAVPNMRMSDPKQFRIDPHQLPSSNQKDAGPIGAHAGTVNQQVAVIKPRT